MKDARRKVQQELGRRLLEAPSLSANEVLELVADAKERYPKVSPRERPLQNALLEELEGGGKTLIVLAYHTGRARPTVHRALAVLIEKGKVVLNVNYAVALYEAVK
jgi:hypothetical protein